MPISINTIQILQEYLQGVLGRADHHAKNLEGVALALLGAIIWKSTGNIEVRGYSGKPANMIWFLVEGNKYTMSFNHNTQKVDLKRRTNNGDLVAYFDNNTTYQQVIDIFKEL